VLASEHAAFSPRHGELRDDLDDDTIADPVGSVNVLSMSRVGTPRQYAAMVSYARIRTCCL